MYKKSVVITFFSIVSISSFINADIRFSLDDLSYNGAVRLRDGVFGDSRLGYANGSIAVNNDRQSVYIVGHDHHQAIAEFGLKEFSQSQSMSSLPILEPVQNFSKVLNRAPSGNPENINRITGLSFIDNKLVINAAQYYDGSSGNNDTTLVLDDPSSLSESKISGFLKLTSRVRGSGWVTPIPASLHNTFGSDYLTGYASNLPINGRNSMGPSAFTFDSELLLAATMGETIISSEILGYSIDNQLHDDHYNVELKNDMWTELSKAYTGFIVPNTNTYAVFGSSGGHEYGIGYKITQDNGRQCGGACSKVASDIYSYYWFYDIDDLIDVSSGKLEPFDVKPFEYGKIELPFEKTEGSEIPKVIGGAYYDHISQSLYFILANADRTQGRFEALPLLLKYDINVGRRPNPPVNLTIKE